MSRSGSLRQHACVEVVEGQGLSVTRRDRPGPKARHGLGWAGPEDGQAGPYPPGVERRNGKMRTRFPVVGQLDVSAKATAALLRDETVQARITKLVEDIGLRTLRTISGIARRDRSDDPVRIGCGMQGSGSRHGKEALTEEETAAACEIRGRRRDRV